jgi:Protein of unknown function (DUF3179)
VYDRELAGRTLSFGVSGALYRNSLIMYDRETGSRWSHLLGAAVHGPLKGTALEMIPHRFTSWGEWRSEHPRTLVLSPDLAPYDSYEGYYESSQTGIIDRRRADPRLDPKDLVLGVMSPSAKAYAYEDLARLGRIRDQLAGKDVEVVYDADSRTAEAFLLQDGARTRLPSTPIFWFAWVDFFPGAPLWKPPEFPRPPQPSNG